MMKQQTDNGRIVNGRRRGIARFGSAVVLAAASSVAALGGQAAAGKAFRPQAESALLAGTVRAVAYSGFRHGQRPDRGSGAINPTREQIREDLEILRQPPAFSLIRLYDCGENSRAVLETIAQHELPIRVMLGAWLKAEISNHEGCAWLTAPIPDDVLAANRRANLEEIDRAIELARRFPEIVVAVNVGNEALVEWNDHLVSIDAMVDYLRRVREAIGQPVTTADNYAAWVRHGRALAPVVDFAAVHTYPVWEGRDIDEAMAFTEENLAAVQATVPEMPIVIAEAGWPSEAVEFPARAGERKQARYFEALMAWAEQKRVTTFWFEAFDEDWKGEPGRSGGAEKHWGLYTVDRWPKLVVRRVRERDAGGEPVAVSDVAIYQTSRAGDRLSPLKPSAVDPETAPRTLVLHPETVHQTLIGIGGAFTESAAYVLAELSEANRGEVLASWFSPEGAHYSLTRTPIASCDFSVRNFTYAPVPGDVELRHFSIEPDETWLLPMIRGALAVPGAAFRILASPWTAPPWMKSNGTWNGGELLPEHEDTFARYLVK
ncbi:MAG: hypothetical protein D6781_02650, partial [Verrucomicrobia bacterium]